MSCPPDGYASPLVTQAAARPAHAALRSDLGPPLTFAGWAEAAHAQARSLLAAGVRPGERVAVFGANAAPKAVALMALLSAGAVPSPQPSEEAPAAIAKRLRAVAPAWAWSLGAPSQAVREALRQAQVALLPAPSAACPRPAADGAASVPVPRAFWPLSSPWAVLCSSGTTGAPKAVALGGQQVLGNTFAVASRLGSLPDDVWLGALPWHHVGGLMVLFRALLLGTAVRLCQPFDAEAVARSLDRHELSLLPLVPTMLTRLLEARAHRPLPARVRAIVLGGAPTPPALLARARALAWPVMPSYGMTETCSQVATAWPYARHDADDVGPPLPGVAVAAGADTALTVRGLMAAGQVHTRDGGTLTADGRVRVHGRLDDLLISGGENVPVEPIEAALTRHPAIAAAAVVGRPDALWGQRPVAFLQAAPHLQGGEGRPSDADLAAFCRARLASFQRPVQFVWEAFLPRDALGKLRRQTLRQRAAQAPPSSEPAKDP